MRASTTIRIGGWLLWAISVAAMFTDVSEIRTVALLGAAFQCFLVALVLREFGR